MGVWITIFTTMQMVNRLFPDGFNPLLFYFICVLWAVVLAACLIFGSGFAFYAMFAAIAVELIGAVYYTFQLK